MSNFQIRSSTPIRAFRPNNVKKRGAVPGWLNEALTDFANDWPDNRKRIKLIHSSGEFSFWNARGEYSTHVFVSSKNEFLPIGVLSLDLEETVQGFPQVNVAGVLPDYHGKGLGKLMYEAAVKAYGGLASSNDLSVGSTASWKHLIKKFKGTYLIPGEVSPTNRDLEIRIVDWEVHRGITYPVFKMEDGSRRSLRELIRGKGVDKDSKDESTDAASDGFYLVRA